MPMKPDVVIWRSLLDTCCGKNVGLELRQKIAEKILESEGVASSGVYMLLSRVYASATLWNEVGLVKKLMMARDVRKEPGCNSMEIHGVNHEPFADTSHSQVSNKRDTPNSRCDEKETSLGCVQT